MNSVIEMLMWLSSAGRLWVRVLTGFAILKCSARSVNCKINYYTISVTHVVSHVVTNSLMLWGASLPVTIRHWFSYRSAMWRPLAHSYSCLNMVHIKHDRKQLLITKNPFRICRIYLNVMLKINTFCCLQRLFVYLNMTADLFCVCNLSSVKAL